MYFHGARFSNYEAWLSDPTHIKPSAQVVWPVVGQEILNGDVGGGFQGIQITSGFFQLWRASGITSELQLYTTAIGGLVMAAAMFFAGWFHYHKAAPKLEWFRNVESMLNHHLAGLLGLGSLGWAGHQIHVSLPVNKLLDAGVDPKEIPLPHDFLLNRQIMADLYPSFAKGLAPFFTLQWGEYSDFLTFNGGLNPVTGGLWLSDTAHHHVAIAVLFLVAGHMYRTNWGIGHSMKEILESHKGPFTGEGHVGLYEILTTSWHAQLAINLAMFGSLSIIVAHHMYSMPPYPYLATDYGTQLSLFTHHNWIGGFCIVGAGAHAAIFMVRDYDPTNNYNNLLDRVIRHRDAIISHLNWVCIFLGFHSFGLYIHNDTMSALGRPQDMFSDTAIQLQPVFAQWIQKTHFLAPQLTAPNALASTSATWGGDVVAVGGKVAMMPISLGTADFMVRLVMDHTTLRSMLEQSVRNFSPYLNRTWLGVRENLLVRTNQQVIETINQRLCLKTTFLKLTSLFQLNKCSKTSETTREATEKTEHFSFYFDFSDFMKELPQHIRQVDPRFLTWFVGFFEGDGSISYRDSKIGSRITFDAVTKRADFEITQEISNIQLLHKIRKLLGFGRVLKYEKNGKKYARFYTSKREYILKIVYLFNGNLVLIKRREQFTKFLNAINQGWQLNIPIKPFRSCVTLQNAWLSGFTDADGAFYTNSKNGFKGTKDHNGNVRFRFITKYSITQDDETDVLTRIKELTGATNKITQLTNGYTQKLYNRLEITSSQATSVLIDYFTRFPLKGNRRIDCLRWARVHGYKIRYVVLNEGAGETLAGLLRKLQYPGEATPLSKIAVDFSFDEKELFNNLPLNKKSPKNPLV
jgi:hypothetical protein